MSISQSKPRIFVGSSSESLEICYALQANLEGSAQVTVWTQDAFKPSEFILESLLGELDRTDVGIFVFSPDDAVIVRGVEYPAVRDNVILEIGLFIGRLGRDRCFLVYPRGSEPKLPTDLLGVSMIAYEGLRDDRNFIAALGPASNHIRKLLRAMNLGPRLPKELLLPMNERVRILSRKQKRLLDQIEYSAPTSFVELSKLYPEYSEGELHYRLEQLRLLQFVSKSRARVVDDTQTILDIGDAYRLARPDFECDSTFKK